MFLLLDYIANYFAYVNILSYLFQENFSFQASLENFSQTLLYQYKI
ncbi:hypothetical protein HMPREF1049_1221 [Fusobacterium necrophorum subsp. funduliforme ATCC 51357]|nr:hypothetical protein HMPREF1049_1221 [Fusobacterium necrophorum subsp. funduliforme ATCC 51357]